MTEVLYEVADHVATITLERSRADEHDLRADAAGDLRPAARGRSRSATSRCIVLTGEGRAFCAGLDLQAQMAGPKGGLGNLGGPQSFTGEFELRDAPPIVLHNIDTPTVCALNGGAAGYGLDLALGCDIRIAADTRQAQPRLRQARHPARERWHVAAAADGRLRQGRRDRVHRAHAHGRRGARTRPGQPGRPGRRAGEAGGELAGEIAANAPLAVRAIKRMMRAAETETFEQNVHHVFLQLLPLLRTDDFTEGVTAFMEKRPARVHRSLTDRAAESPMTDELAARGAGDDAGDPPLHRRPDPRRRPRRDPAGTPGRAPSGSNRQPFRFLVLRDGPNARRRASRCSARPFRSGWEAKRVDDGYRPSRFADSMQQYVDDFEDVPVVVLVVPRPVSGAVALRGGLGVPGLPEPAARGAGARVRRGAHDVAPRRRGRTPRDPVDPRLGVALSACITLGVPGRPPRPAQAQAASGTSPSTTPGVRLADWV